MELQLSQLQWFEVIWLGVTFFAALYVGFGLCSLFFTCFVLPSCGIGRVINEQPVARGQLWREITCSFVSILVFGVGLIVPWYLYQIGWLRLAQSAGGWQIALEMAALVVWNEVHFYANHRLLHTRVLRRFHLVHHKSIRTTPWSTYSFHPIEALMLGSVILLPAVLHDFSLTALVFIPVWSIVLNNVGHSNYASGRPVWFDFLSRASAHHALHHTNYHGNYGFFTPWLDRWCGTEVTAATARKAQ